MQTNLNFWNPWNEVNALQQEMGRLFGRRWDNGTGASLYPAVNLWGDDTSVVLTAELPGFDPQELDITVQRNSITLKGERKPDEPKEGETYYRHERPAKAFSRTLELPVEVDPQSADASYEKGVLTLRLSRPETHQPHKVAVKAG